MWRRRVRYHLLKFLRLRESPQSVALGFTLGACSNFLPFIGFGALGAAALAGVFRSNIPSSLIGHFLFAPFFPFFFSLNLLVGHLVLGDKRVEPLNPGFGDHVHAGFWALKGLGKSFFLGAGINFVILGIILFFITYKVFVSYRRALALWLIKNKPQRKLKEKKERHKSME